MKELQSAKPCSLVEQADLYFVCRGKGGCGETKHYSDFHTRGKSENNRYRTICRHCVARQRGRKPPGPRGDRCRFDAQGNVRCSRCRRFLSRERFRTVLDKSKARKPYPSAYCRTCEKMYHSEHEAANKERRNQQKRAYKDRQLLKRQAERLSGERMHANVARAIYRRSVVKDYLAEGFSIKWIAAKLGVHPTTVYQYRKRLRQLAKGGTRS
jgi:DNA-binding CsgD family transcriptional regulator